MVTPRNGDRCRRPPEALVTSQEPLTSGGEAIGQLPSAMGPIVELRGEEVGIGVYVGPTRPNITQKGGGVE